MSRKGISSYAAASCCTFFLALIVGCAESGSGGAPANSAPVANAGPDENVTIGAFVTLDGSGSSDADSDPLTYSWSFVSVAAGSALISADITGANTVDPTFTPDVAGPYVVSLVVNDGTVDSAADTVTITAAWANSAPVANAGPDGNVTTGILVALDGSGSSDADSDPLTYSWSFVSVAAGSALISADITGANTVDPTFTPDVDGSYVVSLVANDGIEDSVADQVTIAAYRYVGILGFRVIDAEYSKQMDKIIMVASDPSDQLHIYDPLTGTDTAVNLPLAPTAVSVSPDGLYAAVGHDAWISYLDLSTATVEKTFSVSTDVIDIVLAGNGYVYAFPRIDQWETIRCVNISTEAETLSGTIRAGTLAKLHPGGTSIYGADNGLSPSDIEKYDISGGTAVYLYDSPYHGDYAMCGGLWISEDGLRIFTACGNVFRSSDVQIEDMTYNGSLSDLSVIEHLDHSSLAGKVIAIPGVFLGGTGQEDTEVQVYGYDFLTYEDSVALPNFFVGINTYAGHGRFVFYSSDGSGYTVVIQADASSGMLYDFGVVSY